MKNTYNDAMLKFILDKTERLMPVFLLLAMLSTSQPSAGDETRSQEWLIRQLASMNRFANLQTLDDPSEKAAADTISSFITLASAQDINDKQTEQLTDFARLVFSENFADLPAGLNGIMQNAGRLQLADEALKQAIPAYPPSRCFSGHVRDAIAVNKKRAAYYAAVSSGHTRKLSRRYMAMEYCLLPLAALFDRWAARLNQQGIPALLEDFVPMSDIKAADTKPEHTGILDASGIAEFRQLLRSYDDQVTSAARKKNFAQVQAAATEALGNLRRLEASYNCNLSLTIHLVESAGLAAKNAQRLNLQHQGRADNSYRAFILLQNAGVNMFSRIDIEAQVFHSRGIGIITNYLPVIPFP